MKKVLFFFVVALAVASCAPKAAQQTPNTDSASVKADTVKVDTMATDTAKVDTAKVAK